MTDCNMMAEKLRMPSGKRKGARLGGAGPRVGGKDKVSGEVSPRGGQLACRRRKAGMSTRSRSLSS